MSLYVATDKTRVDVQINQYRCNYWSGEMQFIPLSVYLEGELMKYKRGSGRWESVHAWKSVDSRDVNTIYKIKDKLDTLKDMFEQFSDPDDFIGGLKFNTTELRNVIIENPLLRVSIAPSKVRGLKRTKVFQLWTGVIGEPD